jgi:hypothetical protein
LIRDSWEGHLDDLSAVKMLKERLSNEEKLRLFRRTLDNDRLLRALRY